jgi:hypothetical protein
VLAAGSARDGLHRALEHSCLTRYEPGTHPGPRAWRDRMQAARVRIRPDPGRGLHGEDPGCRPVQAGLSGGAAGRCPGHRIVSLSGVTGRMRQIRALVRAGREEEARSLLPAGEPCPLAPDPAGRIGATG